MSATTFFDKLLGRQRVERQTAEQAWQAIVRGLADGKEPDPIKTVALLKELGKSADDLKRAVDLHVKRRGWREKLDSIPGLEAEQARLGDERAAAWAEFDLARTKFNRIAEALDPRIREVETQLGNARSQAREELIRTCPHPEAGEKVKDLRARSMQLIQERDRKAADATRERTNADGHEVRAKLAKNVEHAAEHMADAAACRGTAARLKAEAQDLDRQAKDLDRQADAAEAAMLEP